MFRIRAVIIACMLLTPAIWVYSETPKEVKQEERKGVLITTAKAELRPVERSLLFVGELQAEAEADVNAEVKGKVLEIYKNLGEAVKKGELIARLDSEEYRILHEQATQALKEAQSRLELARLNRDRADGLFKKGLISERESDEARESLNGLEATVKERQAALKMATKRLRDTDVVAPFSGVIKERFVNAGDYVDDKSAVASVVALSPLKLKASVPERAAGDVRKGMKVFIKVEAYPGKVFEGYVVRVSPSLDTKTRTLPLEAAFSNKDGILKPGFFAKGKVVTKTADKAVFVPEEALIAFAGIKKVFIIENGEARERLIKVGERVENLLEITEGVKEGEVIATSALNKISTGVKVEIKK
ncbi:MAG: efflux RND transporter periplasmic adaptor subunit [Deltaproteobacteria bacterium]|nr:efflux RND transporter periplasmic adaptor subunit [Deltaproteobacteria bacterium]